MDDPLRIQRWAIKIYGILEDCVVEIRMLTSMYAITWSFLFMRIIRCIFDKR